MYVRHACHVPCCDGGLITPSPDGAPYGARGTPCKSPHFSNRAKQQAGHQRRTKTKRSVQQIHHPPPTWRRRRGCHRGWAPSWSSVSSILGWFLPALAWRGKRRRRRRGLAKNLVLQIINAAEGLAAERTRIGPALQRYQTIGGMFQGGANGAGGVVAVLRIWNRRRPPNYYGRGTEPRRRAAVWRRSNLIHSPWRRHRYWYRTAVLFCGERNRRSASFLSRRALRLFCCWVPSASCSFITIRHV
jgi:hypothetical protein